MSPDKKTRLVAAATSVMVLLLFILIAVMIYQMIAINGKKARKEELDREIKRLEQENKETQNDIDLWLSNWKIIERARELDYNFPDDD